MDFLVFIFALSFGLQGTAGFKVTADVTIEGTDVNSPDLKRLNLSLGGTRAEQSPQDPGLFTFLNVPPGNTRLNISQLPEGSYVKSASMGAIDVLKDGLNVGGGPGGPMHVNVVIGSGGTLEGVVLNEKGERLSNATVAIVPAAARRQRSEYFKSTTTGVSGQFKISGIAPGDYTVFAWEGVEQNAWLDPNFLRAYEDRGIALQITEETKANLQLRALRPSR